jgi:type IV pilus assembly protein PilE
MNNNGFTLIELLTVVTIMGILIVVGYPSYQSYLREARRQDALQGLQSFQVDIETYISKNKALPNPSVSPYTPRTTTNGFYTLTYSQIDTVALTYQIVATANTGTSQVNDTAGSTSCSTLTLTNTTDGISPTVCK